MRRELIANKLSDMLIDIEDALDSCSSSLDKDERNISRAYAKAKQLKSVASSEFMSLMDRLVSAQEEYKTALEEAKAACDEAVENTLYY